MYKLVMLETASLGDDVDLSCFEKLCSVTYYKKTDKNEVADRITDADIVIANKAPMTEETLRDAKNLKLIALTATGTNNVDFAYVNRVGIKVANVSGYSTMAVAQHTFAMLLYLYEKLNYYDEFVKNGGYSACGKFSSFERSYNELAGKTFSVVGLGNIGSRVLEIAKTFGCMTCYYSTSKKHDSDIYERLDFDELLSQSDIISIHAPLNEGTRGLFGYKEFEKMKKSAILLNLGRGGIVDEADLADALEKGLIAAAGIDVVEKEPIAVDNPLMRIKDSTRLLITPHIGWAACEARMRCIDEVYKNIEYFIAGKERNMVN